MEMTWKDWLYISIYCCLVSIMFDTCKSEEHLEKIAKAADYVLTAEHKLDSLGLAPRMVIIIGDKTTPRFSGPTRKEKK